MAPRTDADDPQPPATVFLRPIGSPVALGMSGLVAASLVASGLELGWLAATDRHQVALVLLAFAFPLQILAALIAFAGRDGGVGAALGVLGGTWLTTALVQLSSVPGTRSNTLGLFLLAAAGLLAAAAAAAATGKLVPAAVFGVESLRFALAGVYELAGNEFWQDAAGVVGLVVVVLAGYTVLAAALEDARGHTVLPLGRTSGPVEREPGVRPQL